jgi:hypothetical protein
MATSAPMLLAKCCHDLDILTWILQQDVAHLSSFGSLTHFRPENAPEGAPLRCLDGCPVVDECKFDAQRLYAHDGDSFTLNAVTYEPTKAARLKALETSPYGRCVYHSDNDVVDHQTVNMEMADGTTVSMTMQGHGFEECRTMRYDGTLATLQGRFGGFEGNKITIRDHRSNTTEQVEINDAGTSGHGGGDDGLVSSFLKAMRGESDASLT